MKKLKFTDHETGREHLALIFAVTINRDSYAEHGENYAVVKRGRRLGIVWYDPSYDVTDLLTDGAAFEAGPKTMQRIIEAALADGGKFTVTSDYGNPLNAERRKRVMEFTAPCGTRAYVAPAEMRRILESLGDLK